MSVALLLITHNKIATSLMETASSITSEPAINYACVEVPMDAPIDAMVSKIKSRISQLDASDGILIITDMYGGTPSNIAREFNRDKNTRIITGLNLPMLIRCMNYRDLPLAELTEKIVSGGQQSIKLYEDEPV